MAFLTIYQLIPHSMPGNISTSVSVENIQSWFSLGFCQNLFLPVSLYHLVSL